MTDLGAHLLGRVPPPDSRHLEAFPLAAAAPPQGIEENIKRPTLSQYDQRDTPRCVAYSTSRVINWFNKYAFNPDWLYAECKRIDGSPGQAGTNARAACDVLRRKGHLRRINGRDVKGGPQRKHGIATNRWAQSVGEIRGVFADGSPKPVLIGIDWHEAWFQPQVKRSGDYWLADIDQAGPVVGGHEIGVWACSDRRQAFGLVNTWGKAWPALAWLPYESMTRLFASDADACVITDLPTR